MAIPVQSPDEKAAQETYLVLLHALSGPGRHLPWPEVSDSAGAALRRVAEALLDAQTTFHATDSGLAARLAALGALPEDVSRAEFLFADAADPGLQSLAAAASIGSWIAPELGAPLVSAALPGLGTPAVLRGPGIPGEVQVRLPCVPDRLWETRSARLAYPLGWDLFIVDAQGVTGMPRTTVMQPL
jgi:alpha-D-ribose 1-methylphosphonate 5-triphosphate synthase subunit PhnH